MSWFMHKLILRKSIKNVMQDLGHQNVCWYLQKLADVIIHTKSNEMLVWMLQKQTKNFSIYVHFGETGLQSTKLIFGWGGGGGGGGGGFTCLSPCTGHSPCTPLRPRQPLDPTIWAQYFPKALFFLQFLCLLYKHNLTIREEKMLSGMETRDQKISPSMYTKCAQGTK